MTQTKAEHKARKKAALQAAKRRGTVRIPSRHVDKPIRKTLDRIDDDCCVSQKGS